MKTGFLVVLLCLLTASLQAQYPGSYSGGIHRNGNLFRLPLGKGELRLEFCTPQVVRIRTSASGVFEPDEPLMVTRYQWPAVTVQQEEQPACFLFTTAQLKIKLYKSPLRIDIFTAGGQLLSGESVLPQTGGAWQHGDTVGCTKQLQADEHVFGFGERMDFMDQRNKKLRLNVGRGKGLPHITGAYNILEANYSPIPFFLSTKGYGLFLHNAFASTWDMGATRKEQYSFSADGGELDYYFFYGPSLTAVLDAYTSLTGKSPLLPRFALGLHVGTYAGGTWGYEQLSSDKYVLALARKLRALGIPVDILHIDSVWRIFGQVGGKGATSFEWRETFTDPRAMFDSLYALHFQMVGLHIRPRFDNGRQLKLLDTAQQLKYTFPEKNYAGEFVNYFDTAAVNWWWNHGAMRVAAQGAKFFKTDEGSAFGGLANESNKTGPSGAEAKKLHNLFPIAYAKAPYEKFQSYNGTRGLNHTREGYAGIQRYPFIFAGDWPSEWQYFAPVIRAGLNIGLSGVGDWTHCMGGFEHPADPELYIRWCQFGMFSPIALVFGMDHPGYKEPWNYGEEALRNFKKYDSLRYRLIPYLYTTQFQQYRSGVPMMRALVLPYQQDENVYAVTDQYMLGDHLMVCPVVTKGAQTRTVYLPEGSWYDYWTGKQYSGKQYIHVVTPLDTLPLFVKAGAAIPMQPVMAYTGEHTADPVTWDIFPGNDTGGLLYEDDGKSLEYTTGVFALTRIHTNLTASGWQVQIQKPQGAYLPEAHHYRLQVHAVKEPLDVTENGEVLSRQQAPASSAPQPAWWYDAAQKILYIQTKGNNTKDISIHIRLQ
jgi:alpha-glucosidase (family GH31 glycosyl hydrolase)